MPILFYIQDSNEVVAMRQNMVNIPNYNDIIKIDETRYRVCDKEFCIGNDTSDMINIYLEKAW